MYSTRFTGFCHYAI